MTPACDFYAATFERLYARLVHAQTRVKETHGQAMGDPACVFSISGWLSFGLGEDRLQMRRELRPCRERPASRDIGVGAKQIERG